MGRRCRRFPRRAIGSHRHVSPSPSRSSGTESGNDSPHGSGDEEGDQATYQLEFDQDPEVVVVDEVEEIYEGAIEYQDSASIVSSQ